MGLVWWKFKTCQYVRKFGPIPTRWSWVGGKKETLILGLKFSEFLPFGCHDGVGEMELVKFAVTVNTGFSIAPREFEFYIILLDVSPQLQCCGSSSTI